jgi:hypothetical protein
MGIYVQYHRVVMNTVTQAAPQVEVELKDVEESRNRWAG